MAEIFLPARGSNAPNQSLLMVERGRGAFATGGTGEVYLAFTTSLKQPVAVKIIRLDGNTEKARKTFRSAMEAHSDIGPSPFIIQYLGCYMYKHFAGVVMEYAVCGSLFDFLHHTYVKTAEGKAKIKLGMNLRNRIVYDIIRGIQFLHNIGPDQRAIHGDLKTSNILLTGELHAKLADFDCTRFQTVTHAQTSCGLPEGEAQAITLRYTAPEVLERPRDKKRSSSDVYSFGLTVWEMWSREIPYAWCKTRDDVMRAILGRIKLAMPLEPNTEDFHLVRLFNRCLESHYSRPTATDIVLNFPLQFSEIDAMQELAWKRTQSNIANISAKEKFFRGTSKFLGAMLKRQDRDRQAVDLRRQIGDVEPTYPEYPEYLRNALDGNESARGFQPGVHRAQSQNTAMPGPSHQHQQNNFQRPVDQQVFRPNPRARFPNFTLKQAFGTFVNVFRGPQQPKPQPKRERKSSSSRKSFKPNERTVLLVGDTGVGKQWLLNQWKNKDPSKQAGKHPRREYRIDDVTYNVVVLSGWKNCNPNKPVHLVLACFAINNLTSLRNLPSWLNRVWAKIGHAQIPVWIIALKEDLRERFPEQIIPDQEVQSMVVQLNPQGCQKCSARDAYDVENLFDKAIRYLHSLDAQRVSNT